MTKTYIAALLGGLACVGMLSTGALAQKRDRDDRRGGDRWTELGCKQVSFIGKDRDTIKVGRADGRFKAIRLSARGTDVEMLDLKVIYANGEPDDIPVRAVIRAGQQTGALDLKGRERAIRSIDMVYRSRPNFRGLATVCASGLG